MVTLNARKATRGTDLTGREASSGGQSGGVYPMQVRVARQIHTAGDNDIDVGRVSRNWPQVRRSYFLPRRI